MAGILSAHKGRQGMLKAIFGSSEPETTPKSVSAAGSEKRQTMTSKLFKALFMRPKNG